MQVYVNALQNVYEDVSAESSMEQLVYTVCAAVDTCAVAAEVETGKMEENLALKILRVIGQILAFVGMTYLVAVMGEFFGILLAALIPINVLLAVVLCTFAVCWLIEKDTLDDVMETGGDILVGVGRGTAFVAARVFNGFKKLIQWSADGVVKAVKWFFTVFGIVPSTLCMSPSTETEEATPESADQVAEEVSDEVMAVEEVGYETADESEFEPVMA
jgi:hypothetical protein